MYINESHTKNYFTRLFVSTQEQLVRLLQAFGFFIVQLGNKMYTSLGGVLVENPAEEKDKERIP
jgi:hypothetical protein